jgi:hypothetical protein
VFFVADKEGGNGVVESTSRFQTGGNANNRRKPELSTFEHQQNKRAAVEPLVLSVGQLLVMVPEIACSVRIWFITIS